jgi:peroxiredoxin
MKSKLAAFISAALLAAAPALAAGPAAAVVGQRAPMFAATDTSGKPVSLADFAGRTVVLEWVNPGCPYVRKHYDSANMQGTQRRAADRGVVWLAVNSTASGHVDYRQPAAMAAWMQQQKAGATHTLMDSDGKIGRAYGARTTPHLYVIDPKGTLVYAGGIDDKPSADPADVKTAKNYVDAALADLGAGRPVAQAATRPYGCSVKYTDG